MFPSDIRIRLLTSHLLAPTYQTSRHVPTRIPEASGRFRFRHEYNPICLCLFQQTSHGSSQPMGSYHVSCIHDSTVHNVSNFKVHLVFIPHIKVYLHLMKCSTNQVLSNQASKCSPSESLTKPKCTTQGSFKYT